jgi:VanZ family protein
VPAVLALAVTVLLGTFDEIIQWIIPNRVFDIIDVGFNAFAAVMAIVASVALTLVRRWVGFDRRDWGWFPRSLLGCKGLVLPIMIR